MFPFSYIRQLNNLPLWEQPPINDISSLTHGGHLLAQPPKFKKLSNSSQVAGAPGHVAAQSLAFFWQSLLSVPFPLK